MRPGRRRFLLAALIVAILAGVACWRFSRWPSASDLARGVRKALDMGRREEARRLAQEAVSLYPRSSAIRAAAAEVELDADHIEEALLHLEQVEDDGTALALNAIGTAGDLLFGLNRPQQAEPYFRRVLARNPQNPVGRQRLAMLLSLSGRRTAAQREFFEIVRGGQCETRDLSLLAEPDEAFNNVAFLEKFEDHSSVDPWAQLGIARFSLHRDNPSAAAELYRRWAPTFPDDFDVQAGFGRALLEVGAIEDFLSWHAALPASADASAEVWNVRGRFAELRGETATAIRCYWEAVRRDPNQIQPNHQLGLLLYQQGQGQEDRAGAFLKRSEQLRELQEVIGMILTDSSHVGPLRRAAELTAALGRPWEALGWARAAERLSSGGLDDQTELIRPPAEDAPQTFPEFNPAAQCDLSSFPRPHWSPSAPDSHMGPEPALSRWAEGLTFADLASVVGLDFTYFNSHQPQDPRWLIFMSSGGGVAAIDYDGDAWPDLYFTQGGAWPVRPNQTEYLDRFFRNQGNGRFVDVTAASGLGDDRYSQGIAAGDVNDDGFPDLYLANIGTNRLYLNNGDGTFTDQTLAAGLTGEGWTSSVLIADLNGDGFPEIYAVTYLAGPLPFQHLCHDKQYKEIIRGCAPSVFPAEPDRLFLNRGDGTFEDVTASAGVDVPDGKGLGVAAFDLDGSGRLSLFVANDTTPNFLFVNQTAGPGVLPKFAEQAAVSGCAVNAEGQATASMGIAVDDADGDGIVDLFVTTFYREYKEFFRQLPGGQFTDATAQFGLKLPSVWMLGFGTQFLDADLDGWPDLAVANGHVDDYSIHKIPYRMRGQFFANLRGERFVELPPAQMGDYFQFEQLGRGMARLDWNRDGREDFAVSNLDTPVSLVTNQAPETGHFLALQLRGVQSNRDALGTTVVATVAGRKLVRQMTAGDGYQASNQRQLVFGLADSESVDELVIRWPSGRQQSYSHVAADSEYLLIEGRSDLVRLPRPALR